MFLSRLVGVSFAGIVLFPTLGAIAIAQEWPAKQPIQLILPFSAGSALDVIGRPVFEQVGNQIGQKLVIEYRTGAGGTIGMGIAAKAEPDGYTLLLNSAVQAIAPSTYKLPFDPAQAFQAIVPVGQIPNVLVVLPDRFKTVEELVATAKAKPGSISYGSGGVGAATHLNAERFRLSAGFDALHVPFRGAPEALREVLGGRVDFYFAPLATVLSLIEADKLVPLAISTRERSELLPNVRTTVEAGYPDSDMALWIGLFAPAGTSAAIVLRLNRETQKALDTAAIMELAKKLGLAPMRMTPVQFDQYVKTEIKNFAKLAQAAGIKPN